MHASIVRHRRDGRIDRHTGDGSTDRLIPQVNRGAAGDGRADDPAPGGGDQSRGMAVIEVHELHKQFIERNKANWERVQIYDFK